MARLQQFVQPGALLRSQRREDLLFEEETQLQEAAGVFAIVQRARGKR